MQLAPRPVFLAGREVLLADLDARLTSTLGRPGPRLVALCGLGGAGKTSVAVEYAHRHLAEVAVCWQFPAEDPAVLVAEFAVLAAQLGARELVDPRDPVASVHAVLARQEAGWLLVFDNALDRASVEPFLPPAGPGRVLITTQNQHWPRGQALDVPVLAPDVAADFLVNRTGDADRAAAVELAGELGGLPLALEQAAAYMHATGTPLARYLPMFQARQADLLAHGEAAGHPADVAATLGLALSRLAEEDRAAASLMSLLAFLAPEPVPLTLLLTKEQPADLLGPEVADAIGPLLGDPVAVGAAIIALRRYSLVAPAGDGLVLVHRLVQAMTRAQLTTDQASQWQQAAAILIETAVPADTERSAAWPVRAALLPHARAVLDLTSNGMRQPLPDAHLAILRNCAVSLLHWCASDLFHDDLRRGPFLPYESVREMLAPAGHLISEDGCDDPDALLIAAALLDSDMPPGEFTVPALGFAYAQGLQVRLLPEQIHTAVRHFGASRLSVRIVRHRLFNDPAPVPASLREALIAALMEYADRLPAALAINCVLEQVGDWERALNVLRPLASQHEPAALRLAGQLAKLGQVDEAEAVLTARINQSEQPPLRLANLLAAQGRQDEAVELLRPLAARYPNVALRLATLLAAADARSEAVQVLQPLSGDNEQVASMLAELYLQEGQRGAAIRVLDALGPGFGSAGLRLAHLYAEDGRVNEAIEVLRPLVLRYRPGAAMRLADLYLKDGKPDDAIAILAELAEEYVQVADWLARLLVEHNRHTEAAQILWSHTPANRSEAFELAKQLEYRGRDERAVNVLRPHAQTWDQAAVRAAGLLDRRGRTAEAIAVLRPLASSSEQACLKLAQLLDASGAGDVINELRDYTGFPAVAVFLARRLASAHRTDDAVQLLRPTADQHEVAAVTLADLFLAAGRSDEAVNTLSPLADRYERVATRLADLYHDAGQRAAAIAVLRPLADRYQQPATRLADLLAEDGDIDGAIEILHPLVGRFH